MGQDNTRNNFYLWGKGKPAEYDKPLAEDMGSVKGRRLTQLTNIRDAQRVKEFNAAEKRDAEFKKNLPRLQKENNAMLAQQSASDLGPVKARQLPKVEKYQKQNIAANAVKNAAYKKTAENAKEIRKNSYGTTALGGSNGSMRSLMGMPKAKK